MEKAIGRRAELARERGRARGEVVRAAPVQEEVNGSNALDLEAEGRLKVFSGRAHAELTAEIADYLGVHVGSCSIKEFADGELNVRIDESVRGCDVFLVQPTADPNENLIELCLMVDACKRASARSITAVMPYFGYGRADRKVSGRESIAAKLVANMITRAGVDRVLALDLHSGQLEGYFDIPLDKIYSSGELVRHLHSQIPPEEVVVVSPDVGGVARARAFAKQLADDVPLAIVDKRRGTPSRAEVTNLIGEVEGKCAVLVDDIVDTAETLTSAAEVLKQHNASAIYACATHAVFSESAPQRLANSDFREVIVTNSIVVPPERMFPQLTILHVGSLLGAAIMRMYESESLSSFRA